MKNSAINVSNIPPGVRENFKAACASVAAELNRPVYMEQVLIECLRYLGDDPERLKAFLKTDE
ncbi:MAG: hypothetical protein NT072_13085 [Deltaproteobacteria bacterium]|nr:hypothetical protein [Deltaproteobacteria bacterium]